MKRCARCGKCRAVCPTFLVTGDETRVARGRINLIEAVLEGKVAPTPYAREIILSCYRCMRCVEACPSGVDVGKIIQRARNMLTRAGGLDRAGRFIFRHVLPRRGRYDLVMGAVRAAQRFLPRGRSQPVRHLPLLYKGKRNIPPVAKRPALRELPELIKGRGEMKVSVFAGCLLNYVYPEVMSSLLRVLAMHGVDVIFPKSQLCCGAPVLALGDVDSARRLALRNVECLEADKVDAVIFGCASCGFTMKHDYPMLFPETRAITSKIYDISEFIDEFLGYSNLPLNEAVTYHDPCHLRWGRGIEEPPRNIVRQSGRFVELEGAGKCCGLGGSFSLTHYEMSRALGKAKAEAISRSGAGIVATSCPGCILQLRDQLASKKMNTRVMHVVQLYEMSYRRLSE